MCCYSSPPDDAMPKFLLSRGDYICLMHSFGETLKCTIITKFDIRKLEPLGYIFVANSVDLSSVCLTHVCFYH